jgi:biopolymer transport protein TolR
MLRGDTAISYGQMMRVMGELNRAGLNSVSLVTTSSSNDS